jgi:hypothetical protein
MLNDKNTSDVIKPQEGLSACWADGINYQVMKKAGYAAVKFVKMLIRGWMGSGRVMSTWREARTVIIAQTGDQEDITNWRPILMTNCTLSTIISGIHFCDHPISCSIKSSRSLLPTQ